MARALLASFQKCEEVSTCANVTPLGHPENGESRSVKMHVFVMALPPSNQACLAEKTRKPTAENGLGQTLMENPSEEAVDLPKAACFLPLSGPRATEEWGAKRRAHAPRTEKEDRYTHMRARHQSLEPADQEKG